MRLINHLTVFVTFKKKFCWKRTWYGLKRNEEWMWKTRHEIYSSMAFKCALEKLNAL